MINYPNIDPIAIHLGPIAVHWYGLMYLLGFVLAWLLGNYRARLSKGQWSSEQVSDIIFYCALGVILGGRIGYALFYDFHNVLDDPLVIIKIWRGGMSFHGGLIGVLVAFALVARKTGKSFFDIADFIAPLVPLGLAAGRMGNFINGELWGRVSDVPWAMIFPQAPTALPRHPSQLYQFLLEGLCLFIILWCYSRKPRPKMAVSGVFLLGYGLFRSFSELFRAPDVGIGFVLFNKITMGQLLSLPLIIIGGYLLYYSYHQAQLTAAKEH